jgi:sialate O-acetylesterase
MIIQRDKPVSVYGESKPGTKVNVDFNDKNYFAKTNKEGKWSVSLMPQSAGGPYDMKIYDKSNQIVIKDILIGDIWIAGGQSNMEWYVEGSKNAEMEIKSANYPNIRIMAVDHKMSVHKLDTFKEVVWKPVTPENIKQFSAVAYFFGRDMQNALNAPIGIINDCWGGTVIETWMSKEAFSGLAEYDKILSELPEKDLDKEKISKDGDFNKWLSDFYLIDQGVKNDSYYWANAPEEYKNWNQIMMPTVWENAGINELSEVNGVVWFEYDFDLKAHDDLSGMELVLGPIDDSDKVWINGNLVGETFSQYNKNRTYKIDSRIIKSGVNQLVVRVEDYVGAGGFTADKDMFYLKAGGKRIGLSGNWRYKIGMQTKGSMPKNSFGPNMYPTLLYNAMINPLINFPVKGVIWYQGESNQYNAYNYRDHFRRFVYDWRSKWNDPSMIFAWVQLANFGKVKDVPGDSQWAEVRESQKQCLDLPFSVMISAIDIGEGNDIHPSNKQEVGKRLSDAVLHGFYEFKEKPYFISKVLTSEFKEKFAIITFDTKLHPLKINNKYGYINGFTIAGEDQKFEWAKAFLIAPDQIKVWNDKISNPKSVRYLWEDNPEDLNLSDSFGLPLLPFRTDSWKLSTQR